MFGLKGGLITRVLITPRTDSFPRQFAVPEPILSVFVEFLDDFRITPPHLV